MSTTCPNVLWPVKWESMASSSLILIFLLVKPSSVLFWCQYAELLLSLSVLQAVRSTNNKNITLTSISYWSRTQHLNSRSRSDLIGDKQGRKYYRFITICSSSSRWGSVLSTADEGMWRHAQFPPTEKIKVSQTSVKITDARIIYSHIASVNDIHLHQYICYVIIYILYLCNLIIQKIVLMALRPQVGFKGTAGRTLSFSIETCFNINIF